MYIFICSTEIPFDEVSLAITRLTYYDIHAPHYIFKNRPGSYESYVIREFFRFALIQILWPST